MKKIYLCLTIFACMNVMPVTLKAADSTQKTAITMKQVKAFFLHPIINGIISSPMAGVVGGASGFLISIQDFNNAQLAGIVLGLHIGAAFFLIQTYFFAWSFYGPNVEKKKAEAFKLSWVIMALISAGVYIYSGFKNKDMFEWVFYGACSGSLHFILIVGGLFFIYEPLQREYLK